MALLLILVYALLFLGIMKRLRWHSDLGWPFWLLLVLFAMNVLASTLNLAYHAQRYEQSDAAFYFEQARTLMHEFQGRPGDLFYDVFFNWGDWRGRLNFLNPDNTPYWSNLGSLFNGKFMLLATFLGREQLYVTPVFYTASFFVGQLYLYKTALAMAPHKKWVLLMAVFLLPSVLFWCQGIHKDGWMMAAFGFLFYGMWRWSKSKSWKYVMLVACALAFSLLVRYFYIMLLLPPLFFWWLSAKRKQAVYVFLWGYAILLLLIMVSTLFVPSLNPMPLLLSKQKAFVALQGTTSYALSPLSDSFTSLFVVLPEALWHVLLSPPVNAVDFWPQVLACLDSVLVFSIWLFLLWGIKRHAWHNRHYLFLLAYAISCYVLIGITIPNTGALLRYRSEYMLFITLALVGLSDAHGLTKVNNQLGKLISL